MKYITRRSLGKSIRLVNKPFNFTRLLLEGIAIELVHFVLSLISLGYMIPFLTFVNNPINFVFNLLFGLLLTYPFLLVGHIVLSSKKYKESFNNGKAILQETASDMKEMGFDLDVQNLVDAKVETILLENKRTFTNPDSSQYVERIIKIRDRKSKLLVLLEVAHSVQQYAYVDPVVDNLVHLLDEEEYARILNRKNM